MTKSIRLDSVWQASSNVILCRVLGIDGEPLPPSAVSTIVLKVFDVLDATTVVSGPTSLTVADVLLTSLQTDSRWTKDDRGYNFAHRVLPAQIPNAGKVYRFRFKLTLADGGVVYLNPEIPTKSVYSTSDA